MKVIGIDLSGPRNFADTCLVGFEERGDELHRLDVLEGATDEQILEAVSGLGQGGRVNIGIDAPLSYHSTGGYRTSDRELFEFIKEKGGGAGIMAPTMMRMVYLTLRGISLTRLLESLQIDLGIVEIHPGASMLLRGAEKEDVKKFKSDEQARKRLLAWLENQGVKGIGGGETISDHYVAACAAALGTWRWGLGIWKWRFAAVPPRHPYDFAC